MPNIYLRLPYSRCQFFRHRDPNHVLEKHEPLVFNIYMPEHVAMLCSLTNAQSLTHCVNSQCFSHQQWRNMLSGRSPLGGNVIIRRDSNEYLTFAEVQQLSGKVEYNKSENEDYLCIKLPNEVEVVDVVRPVTSSWNLDTHGIRKMVVLLNNAFKRSLVEWALSTFDFCTSKGRVVCRCQTAMLERYLMRYGIEPTWQEKDNLRRVIDRWLRTEHSFFKAYSCVDMQYVDDNEAQYPIEEVQWI